ncbi:hypothetical protein AB1Y20_018652 [Prymnesium parvum]|uniref:Uncharacterized protein n=1 Tax=Prymnesium parvum TaxID=97485 RepID=A0AB34JRT0_PRYPA|mmetsp:Transcript_32774/g.68682  ORF Transcript_32774/g.68682 Transcript_32774/m.68682 type:complete len:324 (-) Transcript_32774:221-1192(-)|eukprot:CAMPEP_0184396156 /NCGR_PEP_ID=MMETSP0007-20130409/46793_1 /TAXON_ID=97485 /ORGANISM="Prymnesium parvum, Strain Texoma1" /LENGTH=323 /DNA_ID=CAMNT_0026748719 /DNA_START=17 /DNA_END=988 /DNA_ORIENTATION=-
MGLQLLARNATARPPAPSSAEMLPAWQIMLVSCCVALAALTFGMVVVHWRWKIDSRDFNPLFLSAAAGFIAGLALLDQMADAVTDIPAAGAFACFLAGIVFMYALERVLLEHVHPHINETTVLQKKPAGARALAAPWRKVPCPDAECGDCDDAADTKSLAARGGAWVEWMSVASVLLRLAAWLVHGFMDGALIGSATSTSNLVALGCAMGACSVVDVSALLVSLSSAGLQSLTWATCAVVALVLTIPIGSAVFTWAVGLLQPAVANALGYLRACSAGVLIYMVVFEMAPPHVHTKLANLKLLTAFCLGVGLSYGFDRIGSIES